MSNAHYKEAYDLASSQLSSQKSDLHHYRGQASICAAVVGLIGTVFVTFAQASQVKMTGCTEYCLLDIKTPIFFILLSFSLSILMAIAAVVSWQRTVFDLDPKFFVFYGKEGGDISVTYSKLVEVAEENFAKNENVLEDAKRKLSASFILGWLQIPAWIFLIY